MFKKKKPYALSDILKSENSESTRIYVKARGNEVLGFAWHDFFYADGSKIRLLALSEPENGKILLQPCNCTISLRAFKTQKELFNKYRSATGKPPAGFIEQMKAEGRKNGITYIDFPTN